MATHDMDAAYAWADRILIFGAGRIAAAGNPAPSSRTGRCWPNCFGAAIDLGDRDSPAGGRCVLPADAKLPRRRDEVLAALAGRGSPGQF